MELISQIHWRRDEGHARICIIRLFLEIKLLKNGRFYICSYLISLFFLLHVVDLNNFFLMIHDLHNNIMHFLLTSSSSMYLSLTVFQNRT